MQFSINLLFAFAALSALPIGLASPVAESANEGVSLFKRTCGEPIGNCYANGCAGDQSADGITCTKGTYAGCPCGYGCSATYTGPCYANGCAGTGGRCTKNYRGCSCT